MLCDFNRPIRSQDIRPSNDPNKASFYNDRYQVCLFACTYRFLGGLNCEVFVLASFYCTHTVCARFALSLRPLTYVFSRKRPSIPNRTTGSQRHSMIFDLGLLLQSQLPTRGQKSHGFLSRSTSASEVAVSPRMVLYLPEYTPVKCKDFTRTPISHCDVQGSITHQWMFYFICFSCFLPTICGHCH